MSIFSYVTHTRNTVLLSAADLLPGSDNAFARDPFFARATAGDAMRPVARSVLALPIIKGGQLIGLLYLEYLHHDVTTSFSSNHMHVLQLLLSQAALSIENARFTRQLQDQNAKLLAEVQQRQEAEEAMRKAKETAEAAAQSKSAFLSKSVLRPSVCGRTIMQRRVSRADSSPTLRALSVFQHVTRDSHTDELRPRHVTSAGGHRAECRAAAGSFSCVSVRAVLSELLSLTRCARALCPTVPVDGHQLGASAAGNHQRCAGLQPH